MSTKVLITVPNLSYPGGVASLYNILKMDKVNGCEYFELHGKFAKKKFLRVFDLLSVFSLFRKKIKDFDIVHVNPSLDKKSFIRDGMLTKLALKQNKKVLVYWHGWQEAFEEQVHTKSFYKNLFSKSFLKAHTHIVLGSVFKERLIRLGVKPEDIIIESNAADDTFLKEGKPVAKDASKFRALFIARIEKKKGIYIAIDAIESLSKKYDNLELLVAGSGGEYQAVRDYVEQKGVKNIIFSGHIGGRQKHELFEVSDVLLFPTYYPEGMPISIIEAMLYGLPVITRPVGGIADWVEEGTNGFLIESLDVAPFEEKLEKLISDKMLLSEMSENNRKKAQDYFVPAKVTQRLFNYYQSLTSK